MKVARRAVLASGLIPLVLVAGLTLSRPAFLSRLDNAVYDTLVRLTGTTPPAGGVVIVDVDERSLAALGQWPWRRSRIGEIVGRLRDAGAASVALDIVFAEPDRFEVSGEDENRAGPTRSDTALADAIRPGRVVLGYAMTFEGPPTLPGTCYLHPPGVAVVEAGDGIASPFFRATGAICNLPLLARAAGASGFLNAAPDADGIVRRVPLLIDLNGQAYPSLALAAVTTAGGTRNFALRVTNVNATTLMAGDRAVPLDGKSNLLLRYRGPKRTFPYVSVADVMSGRFDSGTFQGKIVFVGATALGTREVVATPHDTLFTGVEVQATVADNLLRQDFFHRPEYAALYEMVAVLVAGLVVLWLGRLGPAVGTAALCACLAAVWSGAVIMLSTQGLFLSPLFPTAGSMAVLATLTVARVYAERRRADVATEGQAVSQRLMIQSLLSLVSIRDAETGRHSARTQRYAKALSDQLARHPRFSGYLTPERVELLSTLAPLHDIGKVGVPDHILNKPGPLTPEETVEIQKHPAHGRDVIRHAESRVGVRDDAVLELAKEICYSHHERWDGKGYPEGLAEEDIPIPGRVMAVVDVYDAVITRAVYRPPLPHPQCVALIKNGSGTHFDPAVVEAFLVVAPLFESLSKENDA